MHTGGWCRVGSDLVRRLWPLVVHLRLPFQLLLAPFFLWGWVLSGGGVHARVLVAWVAFHVFLYGGATAFNSYYDRDAGPVGGLERPPPVTRDLLPFSLAMKTMAGLLALFVNGSFFWLYLSWVLFSLAYSHPSIRLKAHPVASLLSIGLFQGAVAFLAGWAAARGDLASVLALDGLIGAAAATVLLFGLYPLTQVYQVEEDRARGDRTIAVAWGPSGSFALALVCQALGGLLLVLAIGTRFGAGDAALVTAGLLVQLVLVWTWARRFDPQAVLPNYRTSMRLNRLSAAAISAYLVYRLTVTAG